MHFRTAIPTSLNNLLVSMHYYWSMEGYIDPPAMDAEIQCHNEDVTDKRTWVALLACRLPA